MRQVFDVVVNENNQLQIDLYKVELNRRNKEQKQDYYRFTLLDSLPMEVDHISDTIQSLNEQGIQSYIEYDPSNFFIPLVNVGYSFRALTLPFSHELLETVYDEVIIDDICYLYLYITYINVKTGEVKALKVNNMGMFSFEKEKLLKECGYKHIGSSFLGNFLITMNSKEEKPFSLNRRKK